MSDQSKFDEALALLEHSRSTKRRSGALRLRKMCRSDAGSALLRALRSELMDPRTWETQYQMIMALAECNCREALPFLRELAEREFEATMLYVALGDAMVRLSIERDADASIVLATLRTGNLMLVQGAFRAIALMRMPIRDPDAEKLVDFALRIGPLGDGRGVWLWLAAAAAGWKGPTVSDFLQRCVDSGDSELVRVSSAALKGKYLKFNPL